jgi:hypothetical protein
MKLACRPRDTQWPAPTCLTRQAPCPSFLWQTHVRPSLGVSFPFLMLGFNLFRIIISFPERLYSRSIIHVSKELSHNVSVNGNQSRKIEAEAFFQTLETYILCWEGFITFRCRESYVSYGNDHSAQHNLMRPVSFNDLMTFCRLHGICSAEWKYGRECSTRKGWWPILGR